MRRCMAVLVTGLAFAVLPAPARADTPPVIVFSGVQPTSLPSTGGSVLIGMTAVDLDGPLAATYALVTAPDGTTIRDDMARIRTTQYATFFDVPANLSPLSASYAVTVVAVDGAGQTTSAAAGTVTVAGRAPGRIAATPDKLVFAEPGTRAVRVMHHGRRDWPPITVTVASPGGAFAVIGPRTATLGPGETRTFTVAFSPPAPGGYSGTLAVERSDGAQAGLAVRLSGRAR
jgi:hypothetical protein